MAVGEWRARPRRVGAPRAGPRGGVRGLQAGDPPLPSAQGRPWAPWLGQGWQWDAALAEAGRRLKPALGFWAVSKSLSEPSSAEYVLVTSRASSVSSTDLNDHKTITK